MSERVVIAITVDRTAFRRENVIAAVEDTVADGVDVNTMTDEKLLEQYVWSTLGSNMDFDGTGCGIADIKISDIQVD